MPRVAVVLGTYNRKHMLVPAIESVRRMAGCEVYFIVVDGGSTDGSREWLAEQTDVVLIGQRGALTGAVRAFNLGFAYAVDDGAPYVFHFNDDAELISEGAIARTVEAMEADPTVGATAFQFNAFGDYGYDHVHGRVYSNFGVIRTQAGIEAARAMGDATGRAWWNPIYKTYGADSELGCWLWKLGWRIVQSTYRVKDKQCNDALRAGNGAKDPDRLDSKIFWERWPQPAQIVQYAEDAQRGWAGKRLHLGCGERHLTGWVNVDGIRTPATDVVEDFFVLFRRIPQRSLLHVYWSHGPEHVAPDALPGLLVNIKNSLAPGGKLTVATIDLEGIVENRYKSSRNGSAWNAALYGEVDTHHHPYLAHRQCFSQAHLTGLLQAAGFQGARRWKLDEYPEIRALNDYAVSCELVTCFAEGVAP